MRLIHHVLFLGAFAVGTFGCAGVIILLSCQPAAANEDRPTLTLEERQTDAALVAELMLLSTEAIEAVRESCPFSNETLCHGHTNTVQGVVRKAFAVVTQLTEGTNEYALGDGNSVTHFINQRARMHAEAEHTLDTLQAVIDASLSN